MGAISVPLLIAGAGAAAGGGIQAIASIFQGKEQAAASRFEAQQYETQGKQLDLQKKVYETAGAQAEAQRREDFTSSLETIIAVRAGRGVGEASPTASAIYNHLTTGTERDIATERLNYMRQADAARIGAKTAREQALMLRRQGKAAIIAGYLGAGAALAGSGQQLFNSYQLAKAK